MTPTQTTDLRLEVELFLYREARLADENEYSAWEALWTDEAVYWVPSNQDDYDPTRHVSILYDDRNRIAGRVARLLSGHAHSQDPPSRLRRMLSNIEVEEAGTEISVGCNFLLVEFRHDFVTWCGRIQYRLRRGPDGLRMSYKKVVLVNNDSEIPPLAFLI